MDNMAAAAVTPVAGADDLERAGTREAIALYEKLLNDYPPYERNDQVLYQMSRAYEELGQIDEAMTVMDRMVRDYPRSRYIDEVQFRRAEYFFTRRRYLDAERCLRGHREYRCRFLVLRAGPVQAGLDVLQAGTL